MIFTSPSVETSDRLHVASVNGTTEAHTTKNINRKKVNVVPSHLRISDQKDPRMANSFLSTPNSYMVPPYTSRDEIATRDHFDTQYRQHIKIGPLEEDGNAFARKTSTTMMTMHKPSEDLHQPRLDFETQTQKM